MKICFDISLPNGDSWTDVWEFDRWGNMVTITSLQQVRQEVPPSIGRQLAKETLELYFKYVASPRKGVSPRIEWTPPVHPNETLLFLTMQEHARLLYPDYEPVPTDQPKGH